MQRLTQLIKSIQNYLVGDPNVESTHELYEKLMNQYTAALADYSVIDSDYNSLQQQLGEKMDLIQNTFNENVQMQSQNQAIEMQRIGDLYNHQENQLNYKLNQTRANLQLYSSENKTKQLSEHSLKVRESEQNLETSRNQINLSKQKLEQLKASKSQLEKDVELAMIAFEQKQANDSAQRQSLKNSHIKELNELEAQHQTDLENSLKLKQVENVDSPVDNLLNEAQKLLDKTDFDRNENVHAVDSVSPIQNLTSTQDLENIAKQLTKTEPIVKKEEKTFNDIKLKPKAEGQKTEMTEETKQELIKNKPFLNEISKPKAVKLQENTELEDIFGAKGKNEEKQEPQTTKTNFGATALPADKQKEQTSEFPKYTFGAPQNKTDKSNDQKPMGFGAKNDQNAQVAVNTKPTSFKFGNVGLTNTDDQKNDAKILSKEEQPLPTFKNTIVDNKTIANNKIEPKNIINQDDQVIPTINNKGLKDKTEEKPKTAEPKTQPENKTAKVPEAEIIIQDVVANSVVNQKSDKQEEPKSKTVTKDKPQGMLFSDKEEEDQEKDEKPPTIEKPTYNNLFGDEEEVKDDKIEEKDTKSEAKTQQFGFNFGSKKNEVINTEEMPLPAFNKNKAHFEPNTEPVKNKTELTEDIEIKPKINMKPSLLKKNVPDDFQPEIKKENFSLIKEAEKSEPALPFIEDYVNGMDEML
ncbi:Hypothetical_protein [Hexamita inflata]|uniref:Hypothetical_protein n=1 Tax=Hexamita inflata TaxID=28002 RepID=A0AA86QMY7_9EUKA|nr:Hypothetical protein HINF_LOCUS49145 [Hexamita inflata]